jgi:hypothetical protein
MSSATSFDKIDDRPGIVTRSATRSRSALSHSSKVGAMVLSDDYPCKHSLLMGYRVDLGAQSSARTTDGVTRQ